MKETGIGKSLEDYLEVILILDGQLKNVRSIDVANYMNFSKPSVTYATKELKKKGYLVMDEKYNLHLTLKGKKLAECVYERHQFFYNQLIEAGVPPEVAERDACRMEHVISEESFQKLKQARFT
ncbi:metal-dependent transcriptional regulator [Lachnospiraceae bacterium 54-53]